jgi:predicted component of type VI protein secretion system
MIQLKILSGKKAGTSWVARRFPVRIGRSENSDLQVDDPGVWDDHLQIDVRRKEGFFLTAQSGAHAAVNSERISEPRVLRNGDTIEIGGARLQFWLGQTRQKGLRLRESLTWLALAAISLSQIALIYLLSN